MQHEAGKNTRRPENTAQMAHRALKVHASLGARPAIVASPEWRAVITRDSELSRLDVLTQASLQKALAASLDDARRTSLIELSKNKLFTAFSRPVMRAIYETIALAGQKSNMLAELTALVTSASFIKLSEGVKVTLLGHLQLRAQDSNIRRIFTSLIALPGFLAMNAVEQRDLLGWISGPTTGSAIAAMRKNRLELFWTTRRNELTQLLRKPEIKKSDDAAQAEILREFLYAPSKKTCFLDATDLNGHAIVVFGEPKSPHAWSYGRRFVVAANQARVAKISCPDPAIQSAWKHRAIDANTLYSARTVKLSRRDEHALISWVEKSYVVSDDLRVESRLGPINVSGEAAPFVEAAFAAALRLASGTTKPMIAHEYLRAGKAVEQEITSEIEAGCDRLLAEYLCA